MQSKMTEREFREVLRVAVLTGFDDAVKRAREAGLEFAPEPPSLPETVVVMEFHGGAIELCPGGRTWVAGREEKRALYQEAKARYDAYPSLRAAAVALALKIRCNLHESTQAYVDKETRNLEDELAKGPK